MNNKTKGSLFMIASAFAFAFMQICIAFTADDIPLFEQLFFRNLFATCIAYIGIKKLKLYPFGDKVNRPLLTLRSSFGFLGMISLFYASGNANQGDVSILGKMSPFFVTLLAVIFLKEKINKYQLISLCVAFTGAYIVCNPELNSNLFPLFVAFLSAVFSGVAYTCVSALKGKEHPNVIIFYFSFFSTILTIPFMVFDFVIPSLTNLFLLVMIGILAAIGQLTLTQAYTISSASEVSIYNYSGIIFSMLLGYVFLGQSIASSSMIGAVLVIIAGLIVYFGNQPQK